MMAKFWKRGLIAVLAFLIIFAGGAGSALAKDHGKDGGKPNGKGNGRNKVEIRMEFRDVDMDWAIKHIASLAAKKVLEGYADGTFRPNQPVTRLEAIVTAVRLMNLREEAESEEKKSAHLNLKDSRQIGEWARGYVAVALENDLFFETEDKLQPNKPADRLWITTLLVKALGLNDEARAKMNTKLEFRDAGKIPAGSVGYVAVAVEKGIVKGYPDNTFRPNQPVTRAEIAAFLDRAGSQLPDQGLLSGVLKEPVSGGKMTLTNGQTYDVDPGAFVFRNGKRIALGDLKAGELVYFRTYQHVVIFIEVAQDGPSPGNNATRVSGTLMMPVTQNKVYIHTGSGQFQAYDLAADAVITRNGSRVKASELQSGDQVTATVMDGKVRVLSAVSSGQSVTADVVGTLGSPAVSGRVLTVYHDGKRAEYALAEGAVILRGQAGASAPDLKAGDEVFVRVDNSVVTLVHVLEQAEEKTLLQGTITVLAENRQAVAIRGNNDENAYVFDDHVRMYRNGKQANASDLKVGDAVFAKADKTTNRITFLEVTEPAENREFTVSGLLQGIALDDAGRISTISILQTIGGSTQVSIYEVSDKVKITGNSSLLVQNRPVELVGKNNVITEIRIL
jgi:hypothetical protein